MFKRQHRKLRRRYHVFAISAILLFFLISYDKHKAREGIYHAIDSFESQDLGISGIPGLYGRSHIIDMSDSWLGIFYTLISEFPEKVLLRADVFLSNFFRYNEQSIDTISLDIGFKEWEALLRNRHRALRETRLLIQRDKVKFKGQYKDTIISGKLRLKGDFSDHWRSIRRMSLNISLEDGSESVKGYRRFNLHKPAARQFPYEPIFQKIMNRLGIASVQHDFVHVIVNGVDWGVMNIQETYSKELLEKQKLKDSLVIKLGDESEQWKITSKYGQNTRFVGGSPHFTSSVYKGSKYLQDKIKRDQYSYIIENIEKDALKEIVHVDKFANMAISTLIWGDGHVARTSNSRYYLNPYTLKLEPLSSDQSQFRELEVSEINNIGLPNIYKFSLEEVIKENRLEELVSNLSSFSAMAKEYGGKLKNYFPNDYPINYDLLDQNLSLIKNNHIKNITDVDDYMTKGIGPLVSLNSQQWNEVNNFVTVRHYSNGRVRIYNNLPISVVVERILHKGINILEKNIILEGASEGERFSYRDIDTKITGIQDSSISVVVTLDGFTKVTKNNFTHTTNNFNPLEDRVGISNTLPPYIIKKQGKYVISSGDWIVEKPLVIHGDLVVEPATTLRFTNASYLIVKGNVVMDADKQESITLTGLNSEWKGVYILGKGGHSVIRNVYVDGVANLQDGVLTLSGSFNVYNSNVLIKNFTVKNISAEDAINIVNSKFNLEDITISGTRSDAIDLDFSYGNIKNLSVSACGGDALDLSGSKVVLDSANISDVRDKGLSIGESSEIFGSHLEIGNIGVGIAVKDGSSAQINNTAISDYKLAGVMTYMKKDFYGKPTLKIQDTIINSPSSANKMLRQKGTGLYSDNALVESVNMNIKELYQTSVMKKNLQ